MAPMTTTTPPTERLDIVFPPEGADTDEINQSALEQISDFAAELRAAGKPARFQVWYPQSTDANFDAVEVADDGTITTLPPFDEEVAS